LRVFEGPFPLEETNKPEYETLASFGAMCMNKDLLSIFKLNDICNRTGLDTISAGSVIAFAMECYEKGVISKSDTEGIELTWGNGGAMIAMLNKMAHREGLGDILDPDKRLGKGETGSHRRDWAAGRKGFPGARRFLDSSLMLAICSQ